ncbi:unnamed protein product [Periconia digitata]|uniref:Transmembrane protein n=1 Tax=Periconia digitata TaxID=1303443 RepID=A0A9W4UH78_9PLEO|nr:unnamed protein product [Periconia digitata]
MRRPKIMPTRSSQSDITDDPHSIPLVPIRRQPRDEPPPMPVRRPENNILGDLPPAYAHFSAPENETDIRRLYAAAQRDIQATSQPLPPTTTPQAAPHQMATYQAVDVSRESPPAWTPWVLVSLIVLYICLTAALFAVAENLAVTRGDPNYRYIHLIPMSMILTPFVIAVLVD